MKEAQKVLAQWNSAAKTYMQDQEKSEFADVNKAVVKERFSELKGKRVLDLGCGYGWYTEYFRSIGADAVGCDGSQEMILLAKANYPACTFDKADVTEELVYGDSSFDLVFCNQVLMDIEEIDGLIEEVYRITKCGGTFYMGIVHPAFYDCHWGKDESGFCRTRTMERYLSEYSFDNDFWGSTRHYHRTVSFYMNLMLQKGFTLVRMEEPISYDGVRKSREFPLFLFLEFKKQ